MALQQNGYIGGRRFFFFGSYISVNYRHWFTEEKTPENWTALQIHLSIGVTIAVVVVLRIIWRISNRMPDLEPDTKLEHLAAHLGHYALYVIIIIMPITGYVGTGVNASFCSTYPNSKVRNYSYLQLITGLA